MPSLPILLFDFALGQMIRIGSVSDRLNSRMIQNASGSSCSRSCVVLGSGDPPLAELLKSKRSYIGAGRMREWKEDDSNRITFASPSHSIEHRIRQTTKIK